MKLELDVGDGVIGGVIGREGEVRVGGVEVAGWRSFIKDNIPADNTLLPNWIPKLPAFVTSRIAQKAAFDSV
jgi:hypothetical protein